MWMGMKKSLILVLILVFAVSSLIMVKPELASAQSPTPTPTSLTTSSSNPTSPALTPTPPISTPLPTPTPVYPKLLVPQFTVNFINSSPEVIELIIKNQPFNSNNIYHYSFFYNARAKIDNGNWSDIYTPEDGYPTQSITDYTVLSFYSTSSGNGYFTDTNSQYNGVYAPCNATLDFQVQAMVGFRGRGVYSGGIMPYVFTGETSDWSKTQTLTIFTNVSPSPASPLVPPEFQSWAILLLLIIIVVFAGLLVYFKKHTKVKLDGYA